MKIKKVCLDKKTTNKIVLLIGATVLALTTKKSK